MTTTRPASPDIRTVDDPPGIDNPYWQIVRQLPMSRFAFPGELWSVEGFPYDWDTHSLIPGRPGRDELVRRYAWAIADPLSVGFVARHAGPGGIVEIGAGRGYWAWQLAQRGIRVAAYDEAPPNEYLNKYCYEENHNRGNRPHLYHPVLLGDANVSARAPEGAALFLCWPLMSPMAHLALGYYPGDTVIYVGEPDGGCTADDGFFSALAADWDEIAEHPIVQYGGIHDSITVYRRKTSAAEITGKEPNR